MRKLIESIISLFAISFFLYVCPLSVSASTFSIQFIDIGQGDSALVECDGHYMLIDGGDKKHGETVQNVLEDRQVRKLDILAVSHFHRDHYAGLITALANISKIKLVISNADTYDNGFGID